MSRLKEIFEHKRAEVAASKVERPLKLVHEAAERASRPLDFAGALRQARKPALIAEVKAASPSRGQLAGRNGQPFDPVAMATTYAENGATAISVLTDAKYFGGSLEHLRAVRAALPQTPLLRKDFVCDPYQVYEARAAGADAVLLIVAALDVELMAELARLAGELGMAALVEVHSAAELELALSSAPDSSASTTATSTTSRSASTRRSSSRRESLSIACSSQRAASSAVRTSHCFRQAGRLTQSWSARRSSPHPTWPPASGTGRESGRDLPSAFGRGQRKPRGSRQVQP